MRGWKIIALVAAFFAAVGALLWVASRRVAEPQRSGGGMKRLSGTVAEGLVYWSPKEPFPRASCDACRIGKVKAGVVSLSPFSTIEFDNLVINLPPGGKVDGAEPRESARGDAVDALGLRPLAAMAGVKPSVRFYGIKVNGFSLSRMVGGELRPVAKARQIRNLRRKIVVEGLLLYEADGERQVPRAELETKPSLAIVWPDGRIDLDDVASAMR